MLVHLVEAVQHLAEILRPHGDHGGQADSRVHGVAAAHPIPEFEHVGRIDAEFRHLRGIGRNGDEVRRHALLISAERPQRPGARGLRIGHRLQRGEGLGGDDEQGLGRIEIVDRLGEIGAVHVGNEPELQVSTGVVAQRLERHHRPQVRAADPDVDHGADGLAGVALPLRIANLAGEFRHLVQHGVHFGDNVLPVHQHARAFRRAQGHVEHRTLLGDVDLLTGKHGVPPRPHTRGVRQLQQKLQRLCRDAVLGVVQEKTRPIHRHVRSTLGILRE